MAKDFIEKHKENWVRLEQLLAMTIGDRLHRLTRAEVREFGRLYRRTAADFAIARREIRDRRLVNYLNNLVGRAHGAIYRTERSSFGDLWRFYRYSFPAIFRETFRYTIAAFGFFLAAIIFAAIFVVRDESFSELVAPGILDSVRNHYNWTEQINQANPIFSSSIWANNTKVAIFAFVTGIFTAIGPIYILAMNGLHIGTILTLCIKYKFLPIIIFMSGHGVLELTAIFISGGAGLLMGSALLMPGELRRREALIVRGLLGIKLFLGCLPMLILAGIIEGFISPAAIPASYKLAVSLLSAILLTLYLLTPQPKTEQTAGR
ncbi:MAG: stage II sporulation protein M [Acidobacteriota bacterium]